MRNELVSPFSAGRAEDKELLGGKGANLGDDPPWASCSFRLTITTVACKQYYQEGNSYGLNSCSKWNKQLGNWRTGRKKFGSTDNPFVSVRSGAPVFMPG